MRKIYLTQNKVALVDDEDWEYLHQWKWCAHRQPSGFYAVRSVWVGGEKRTERMSRVILGLTDPKVFAEHKNGDTLDNSRENLRPATNAQNQANTGLSKRNTKGAKGVEFNPAWRGAKKWSAQIRFGGKKICLGYFLTKDEAADAYRRKALELHGEFVRD